MGCACGARTLTPDHWHICPARPASCAHAACTHLLETVRVAHANGNATRSQCAVRHDTYMPRHGPRIGSPPPRRPTTCKRLEDAGAPPQTDPASPLASLPLARPPC